MENRKKQEATKKKLKDALMQIYATRDYNKITVSDICLTAQLHRSTFYAYYRSIDELLREIEDELIEGLHRFSRKMHSFSAEERKLSGAERNLLIRPRMIQFYQWQKENRGYIVPLLGINGDMYFISRYEEAIRKYIKEGVELFGFHYENNDYVIQYLTGGILKTNASWLSSQDIPLEDLVDLQMIMVRDCPFGRR